MLRPSLVSVLTLILTSSAANAESIAGRASVIDADTLQINGETHCAKTAQNDGRETDHQFWLTVLAHLQGSVS